MNPSEKTRKEQLQQKVEGAEKATASTGGSGKGGALLQARLQGKPYAQQAALLSPGANVQGYRGGSPGDVHRTAAEGVRSSGSSLPHLSAIQSSFGAHDVSGVRSHSAPRETAAIGATAYTMGNDVAFTGGSPDLHTAAHEAAHAVQQRSGISLPGGVGKAGDSHEKHADAVADRVVAGRPAGDLLGQYGGGAGAKGVQSKEQSGTKSRKEKIMEILGDVSFVSNELAGLAGVLVDAGKAENLAALKQARSLFRAIGKVTTDPKVQAKLAQGLQAFVKAGKTLRFIGKIVGVAGALFAAFDIGLNVINIIGKMGDLTASGSAFGKNVGVAAQKCKGAYTEFKAYNGKGDQKKFRKMIGHYAAHGRTSFVKKYGINLGRSTHANFTYAVGKYKSTLSDAVLSLKPLFTAIFDIIQSLLNIAADAATIAAVILGPTGPVAAVIGAAGIAWTFLSWLISKFELTEKAAGAIVATINNHYIWNPFGADVMTETAFAALVV